MFLNSTQNVNTRLTPELWSYIFEILHKSSRRADDDLPGYLYLDELTQWAGEHANFHSLRQVSCSDK